MGRVGKFGGEKKRISLLNLKECAQNLVKGVVLFIFIQHKSNNLLFPRCRVTATAEIRSNSENVYKVQVKAGERMYIHQYIIANAVFNKVCICEKLVRYKVDGILG